MPDDVLITPGLGVTVATDDIGGGRQVQYIKLMNGTDGASDVIVGDATYGLDVDVTRIQDTVSYHDKIAQAAYPTIVPWAKIGFTPAIGAVSITTESDVWSKGGVYTFPPAAGIMEVVSTNNVDDIGVVLHGGTGDIGGSTTTIVKAGENFLTTTAGGDCIILEGAGPNAEWGYITDVTSDTVLTCAGGFSSGGSGASRTYLVIDKSATLGAQAMKIDYLTNAYAKKTCILALSGTTGSDGPADMFRVNSFRVVAVGSNGKSTGALAVQANGDGTKVYSHIIAGFQRARNNTYTVPAATTLYVTQINAGYGIADNTKTQYARIYMKANREPSTMFYTGSLFYPYSEVVLSQMTLTLMLTVPTRLPAQTDIKVSGVASASGICATALRGYLVS